jgi:small basic protein
MVKQALARPGTRGLLAGMVVAGIAIGLGIGLLDRVEVPEWAKILLAIVPAFTLSAALVSRLRGVFTSEGVERTIWVEASASAFFATILAALTWASLESWAGAPKLSMWAVWLFGFGVWAVLAVILRRRLT